MDLPSKEASPADLGRRARARKGGLLGPPSASASCRQGGCFSLWRHTADLIVDPLAPIQATENATVQQQPHHDLLAAAAQKTEDIGPRGLREGRHILVGIQLLQARYVASQGATVLAGGTTGARALEAMGEEVPRLLVRETGAVEEG